MSNRKFSGQVYFIFKLNEYFKNYYRVLQNNRCDSLRGMLRECVVIQNEINENRGDVSRLEKSLDSQFRGLLFWHKNNPLFTHDFFHKPMQTLSSKISNKSDKSEKGDKIAISNHISSFYKRLIKVDIISMHIDIIQEQELTFTQVDSLLNSLVSELLLEGYSLKYLEEWYSENVFKSTEIKELNNTNVGKLLNILKSMTSNSQRFSIILNSWLPQQFKTEFEKEIINNDKFEHIIINNKDDYKIPEIETTFTQKNECGYFLTKVQAVDKYKAIEIAKIAVENLLEVYRQLYNSNSKVIVGAYCFVSNDNVSWLKERIDTNNPIISKKIDSREKEDIIEFIQLRNKIRKEKIDTSDIAILERVLVTINKSTELSLENRLLNMWSCLEYLLAFYHQNSIISKVVEIIPKTLCLYAVKDKMNVLWDRLVHLKEYSKDVELNLQIDLLFEICGDETRPKKYNTRHFSEYLMKGKESEKLYEALNKKIVIQRDMAELHCILDKPNTLADSIKNMHEMISHDLARIYRIRNKLVHSGSDIPDNMEVVISRLNRYITCLMASLIYYMSRTPEVTITEILCSIAQTYEVYLNLLSDKENKPDIKEVVTPYYLFL